MAKVKQFDKTSCREVSAAIETALKKVAVKYGINIKAGNGRFTDNTFDLKLHCAAVVNGKTVTKEALAFKDYAHWYGLKPSDLGKVFESNGSKFKITGINTRGKKYPICAERLDNGVSYKFAESTVKRQLKA